MSSVLPEIFASLLDPINIALLITGVAGGILVGALPGLTATMALALMLPFTYSMEADAALIMLGGIYIGAIYGGSIVAILLNTPGTPSSIATTFDGYPLAQTGKAEHALVAAAVSSGIGGVLGGCALLLLSPLLANLALKFGPPEYFWIAVLGLTIIATISTGSIIKGLIGGCLGLLLSTIGIAPVGGESRFTFGFPPLLGGLQLIVIMIGMFCIPEVLNMIERKGQTGKQVSYNPQKGVALTVIKQLFQKPILYLRSAVIGIMVGIIPGAGGNVASLLSYDMTVRFSKQKSSFGKGNIEGVAASEAGNNAEVGGSLVPLLSLGIPGAAPAAVLLGALMMQGIQPGPDLYATSPGLVYTFCWAFIVANLVMFLFGFFGSKYVAQIVTLSTHYLAPLIVFLSVIGSYAIRNHFFDISMMIAFGIAAYILKKVGFEPGPIVLGLILGPIAETGLAQTMLMAQAQGSVWTIFFSRPLSMVLMVFCLLSLLWPLLSHRFTRSPK
ncbi:tripartite tricarboxylate transporter permease [Desmospora activa]|uniref:Putative tricarboxylic transport membrane protein n=1 Tax=Desmospora activa DSM 45169 TaxID=1121389 RepID=A0A2T4ZC88_9BACL|nr:tripartite tricarboxylate transporter permease [Desmospora activa]PTM59492.1 putative tricarboxylic transport membrane protein [Desmospora activa DSM 45169]